MDLKCVLVGDKGAGQTSLLSMAIEGEIDQFSRMGHQYDPLEVTVEGRVVKLHMHIAAGQDELDMLRPLAYPNTDVFLILFPVNSQSSLVRVEKKWIPEVYKHSKAPIILVGTKADLKDDPEEMARLESVGEEVVSEEQVERIIKEQSEKGVKLSKYIECSAFTQKNLKAVFEEAASLGIVENKRRRQMCRII